MVEWTVAVVALVVVGYALAARWLGRVWLTAPIVMMSLGIALSVVGLPEAHHLEAEVMHLLGEATLVLVLFGDASRIDLRSLRSELGLPVRLLAVGMPLSVLVGFGAALALLPELAWAEAALLAALLAPTDAALGQAVVQNPGVPARIRQALNVESGLNDGLALPLVLIFASLAAPSAGRDASEWAWFVGRQLALGPAIGAAVGGGGGALLARMAARIDPALLRVAGFGLAALAWAGAEIAGGNGFMAAFVGGMAFGATGGDTREAVHDFLESEGDLLQLIVFLAFGTTLLVPALEHLDVRSAIYVMLALTATRMIPVALSCLGTGVRPPTTLFLGWFGPRGLATIVFALLVSSAPSTSPHVSRVVGIAYCAAALSVLLHGISSTPGVRLYARWVGTEGHPEHEPVTEHRARRTRDQERDRSAAGRDGG